MFDESCSCYRVSNTTTLYLPITVYNTYANSKPAGLSPGGIAGVVIAGIVIASIIGALIMAYVGRKAYVSLSGMENYENYDPKDGVDGTSGINDAEKTYIDGNRRGSEL